MAATTEPAVDDLTRRIHERLDEVKDPCSVTAGDSLGLAEMGLVKSVDVAADGTVTLVLRLTSPFCEMIGYLRSEAIARVGSLPAVSRVVVETDSGFDWSPEDMAPHVQRRREERLAAQRADVLRHRALPLSVTRNPA